MKALTIWQPWASLLVAGKKHEETRSWATKYKGELLIHAAKKPYSQVSRILPSENRKMIEEVLRLKYIDGSERIPTGAIIGKVKLVGCKLIDQEYHDFVKTFCPAEFAFGDYTVGRYAWIMEEPVLFDKPIPAKGYQGLWNYEMEGQYEQQTD